MARDEDDDRDEVDGDDDDAESGEHGMSAKPTARKRPIGCLMIATLAGAAMIAAGVYYMGKWAELQGPSRAGSVVLVVIGTLLMLPMVLLFVLALVIKIFVGRAVKQLGAAAEELAAAGKQMVAGNKAMYGQIHEFREADDDDFEDVDFDYYETVTNEYTANGYRQLGDLVDETIEETSGMAIPIRVLASPDGTHTVAVYSLPMGGGMRICDVTTEFSDGTFLMTSNTKESNLMTPPPGLEQRLHPAKTPVASLVAAHVSEVEKLLAAKGPAANAVAINTLDDAIASERRQQEVKNAFRKQIGFIDPDEVKRIGQTISDDPDFLDASANAADQARREERGRE